MAWNLPAQGVYAGDQNINFDRPRHTGFVPQQQQTSDAVQQAIATIAGILKQRQQDKIANQLLAVDNAPKATAVSGQAPDPSKYQPDTQLTQAMMQTNLGMGLPATDSGVVPNRGSWEGLQASDLVRKRLNDQQNTDLKQQVLKERISRYQNPVSRRTSSDGTETPPSNRVYREGYGYVTGGQAFDIDRKMGKFSASGASDDSEKIRQKLNEDLNKEVGITLDQVPQITGQQRVDDEGKPDPNGSHFMAKVPAADGSTMAIDLPIGKAQSFINRINSLQKAPAVNAAATYGGGKSLDTVTAQDFLQQAGGDKEKAREMARAAGYSF